MHAFYFDVGGVLIGDNLAYGDLGLRTFARLAARAPCDSVDLYNSFLTLVPLLDIGELSLRELCLTLGLDLTTFKHKWLLLHPSRVPILKIMHTLLKSGHTVGLATNINSELLELLVMRDALLSKLVICCSADIRAVKPSQRFYEHASKLIGTNNVIFVDDRPINIEAANAYGWNALLANGDWMSAFCSRYCALDRR